MVLLTHSRHRVKDAVLSLQPSECTLVSSPLKCKGLTPLKCKGSCPINLEADHQAGYTVKLHSHVTPLQPELTSLPGSQAAVYPEELAVRH